MIKSCLNRLAKLGIHNVVHNVYFFASAAFLPEERRNKQRDLFAQVVNGRIMNVFSRQDTALAIFNLVMKSKSIGRQARLKSCRYNAVNNLEGTKVYKWDNFDASNEVNGHMAYKGKMLAKLLRDIEFNS